MFVTQAFAQGATPAATPGMEGILFQLLPFVFIFIILYFLIIRPQQRRVKSHQDMIGNIRRGDTVVTAGGFIGKVARVVDENEVLVDLTDNVRVRVVRSTISEVRSKGEPVQES
jgi:preprotein translocase subunit YajC